jgi:hypothetical protein
MKAKLLAAVLLAAPFIHAAEGPLREKALAISSAHKDSVLFLSAVIEIELTAGENPVRKEERKVEILGTVIGADGLIVSPLSTLDVASAMDGRTVNGPQGLIKISAKSNTKEVKILMPDGSEVPAKVAFKDPDLDLAFIRPEKPDGVKLTPVNTAENAPMTVLDDVIILSRLGKDQNREPIVMTSEVISLVSKPRVFGKLAAPSLGVPVFNKDGKFLGVGINRFSAKNDSENQGPSASNMVLPAADLLESADQAK